MDHTLLSLLRQPAVLMFSLNDVNSSCPSSLRVTWTAVRQDEQALRQCLLILSCVNGGSRWTRTIDLTLIRRTL